MPSLLISAAVITVAGAAMNIAVAWGSSLWTRLGDPQRQAVDRALESGFGYEVESVVVTTTRTQMGCFYYPDGIQVENSTPRVIRMGWPLRSLSADPLLSDYYLAEASARRNQYFSQIRESLEKCSETELAERATKWQCGIRVPSKYLPDSALHGRRLAVRPIWPGFAINSLFYAGVLWALFAAPFALRRVIPSPTLPLFGVWVSDRVQRGLYGVRPCRHARECGYPASRRECLNFDRPQSAGFPPARE